MEHCFQIRSSREVAEDAGYLPDGEGVYAALFPDGSNLLSAWGYRTHSDREPPRLGGQLALYIGYAGLLGVRSRVGKHVFGDARVSTLRMTLGVLLAAELTLAPVLTPRRAYFHFGAGEQRLTEWIMANVNWAFLACDHADAIESALISVTAPPLNIRNQKTDPYARHLMALRRSMRGSFQPSV